VKAFLANKQKQMPADNYDNYANLFAIYLITLKAHEF
jgi:hypothetical protein